MTRTEATLGPRPDQVRRLLVIRRRGLGDALVSLPAVAALADLYPRAEVDLLIDRPFAPLLTDLSGRARVLEWPPRAGGLWTLLRTPRYDLVADLLSTPRTAFWTALSGARWRLGYDLAGRRWAYNLRVPRNRDQERELHQYAGEGFLDLVRILGAAPPPWSPAAPAPALALGTGYTAWRDARPAAAGPEVALLLSAGWPAKAWPPARAAEFAAAARRDGARVTLVPGPGDAELAAALTALDPQVALAPPTDLRELADLLGRADVAVTTDGGGRHVAAAVGTPTVTLYGPTDPRGWNREHPLHVAVRTGVDCSPCDLRKCPVPGHPCLDQLAGARVWAATRDLLNTRGARP
ncbi:MAG TPA: glycosyltransferase family 9 protein [Candidatus Krumholzibacteria bacterium]|nr:glycosyltransferase family 9 protein [Candidatus Krumholzibacteria bacterium]HRX50434.1 glycosyltransferase family 9 protein [Candidatus Krumholzibacteria bacterium]